MKKSALQQAAELYQTERRHMASLGWTEAAYIQRYGTTENPIMGDGGSLIWEADLGALFRARDHFLAVLQKEMFAQRDWEKRCPLAKELWDDQFMGIPAHLDTIHSRRAYARGLVESIQTSLT